MTVNLPMTEIKVGDRADEYNSPWIFSNNCPFCKAEETFEQQGGEPFLDYSYRCNSCDSSVSVEIIHVVSGVDNQT